MKVSVSEEAFKPITVTLETQEEFDQFFAIFSYTPITDQIPVAIRIHEALRAMPADYEKWFSKLRNTLERNK